LIHHPKCNYLFHHAQTDIQCLLLFFYSLLGWGTLQLSVCVGYREEVVTQNHVKHYSCTQWANATLLCNLFSKYFLLNLFRLAITKGLNTYWLKTFQIFIYNELVKNSKNIPYWRYNVCRPVTQNVEKVKGCEYFLKSLYIKRWPSCNHSSPFYCIYI
jgi:hypothetical protein